MERFKTPRQTDLFYFNRINAWKTSSELSLVIIILKYYKDANACL